MNLDTLGPSFQLPFPSCPIGFLGGPKLNDVCQSTSCYATFITIFNTLVTLHPNIGDPCGRNIPVGEPDPVYDFIVVGGGAGGAAVAARLSEVPEWKILLLEAGPDEPAGAQVPSNYQLFLNTSLDWKYETTNESSACLNRNGSCIWPRGKNLGGTTTHHGMAYHRGHAKDFERWVEMGNEGWSWEEVLPFYKKSEDNREIGRVSSKYHGTGGPMTVERFPWQPLFAWDILGAAEETGFGVSEDLVGENITGFTVAQTISKNGVRLSSAAAFLRPIRERKNLHVTLDATVTRILTTLKRAKGVIYVTNGQERTVKATREVIIAGGSINSPQLLLLSGIGPKSHLKSMGIPLVHDLPGVGENLHNHLSYPRDFSINDTSAMSELNSLSVNAYIENQSGPLSSTGLAQVTGVLPSSYTESDDPDIQLYFAGYQATCMRDQKISDLKRVDGKSTVRFTSVNLHPRARGRITLASKNPLDHPKIWSNDLGDPRDISIVLEGIRVINALANSTTMQKYDLRYVDPIIPECSKFPFESDDYWKCAIQWDTRPENHQAGTCKMGPSSDPRAVVDPRLKVHGIRRLRIADASIMPQVVSGNPVAAVNMIGERAAHFIKQDWGIIKSSADP